LWPAADDGESHQVGVQTIERIEWDQSILIYEAIVQPRGEAGVRQVPDARVAVSSDGFTLSSAILFRGDS
jgi:hypothetical protein